MKLVSLTLQAFGPYKEKQTISFDQLNAKQLFLISGPTGSGKTSIFDAITYALYGRSSSEGREVDGLVSQFRRIEDVCFVELTFRLKGETYTIYRQPKQSLPRQRGEGIVEKSAEAKLITKDKVFTSISEINQKIEELIGLDVNQFRQTVMLPQGEFRKLLEAKSSEKEAIFRNIFKTDLYKLFQDKLREKTKDMERTIQDQELEMKQLINNLHIDDDPLLYELIHQEALNYEAIIHQATMLNERLSEDLKKIQKVLSDSLQKKKAIEEAYQQGKQQNEKIEELSKAKEALESLIKQEEHIKQLEQMIVQMTEAKFVLEAENHKVKLSEKKTELEHQLQHLYLQIEEIEKRKQDVTNALRQAYEQYINLDQLKEERNKKQTQRERYFEWLEKKEEVSTIQKTLKGIEDERTKWQEELQICEEMEKNLEQQMTQIEEELNQTQSISVQVVEQKARCDQLINVEDTVDKILALQTKHAKHAKEYTIVDEETRQKMTEHDHHYQTYLKSQAGILAKDLSDGQPCPVCGSTHHPRKAVLVESVLTNEELEEERMAVEALKNTRQQLYQKLLSTKEQMDLHIEQYKEQATRFKFDIDGTDWTVIKDTVHVRLIEEEKIYKEYEKALQERTNKEQFFEELKETRKENHQMIVELNERLKEIDSTYQITLRSYHTEKGKLDSLEQSYQLKDINLSQLDKEIHRLKQHIEEIDERYHRLEKEYNECLRLKSSLTTEHRTLEKQYETNLSELKNIMEEFNLRLKNANFTDEAHYREILKRLDTFDTIQDEARKYHADVQFYQKRIDHLEKEVGDKELVNLQALEEQINELEEHIETIRKNERERYAVLRQNRQLLENIKQIYDETNKKIKTFQTYKYLNNVTNGTNVYKLTFERYVLTAYFDEIIHAANIRLHDMTQRRYTLLRDTEYTGGRGHQGLDLLVFDAYTNKKRSVKTLSGGESFMASLALALGLADIVSSYAGGIQLDTIFIDEGFGSLDPVSLDHAISTLNDLKSQGRTVGIISHVEELKERIDAQLEIVKSREGSSIKIHL